jgi:hypothetical protein
MMKRILMTPLGSGSLVVADISIEAPAAGAFRARYGNRSVLFRRPRGQPPAPSTACAAASRAIGTRNGEQLT